MNTKTVLAVAILALATTAGAAAPDAHPQPQTVSGWFASRIVGTYQTSGTVSPCGTTNPVVPVGNIMSFNAGGTVTEAARFPPAGLPNVFGIPGVTTRNAGLGTWSYSPRTNHYAMTLHYDFFVDGRFYGTGTVERDIQLSIRGDAASGPVRATIRAADGSEISAVCGNAVSTRL